MRKVRTFFHCLTLPPSLLLVGLSRALDSTLTWRCGRACGGSWVGHPGEAEWIKEGWSRATACSTFSILKVEQLIMVECSLLSWPQNYRVFVSIREYIYCACSNSANNYLRLLIDLLQVVAFTTLAFDFSFNIRYLHTNIKDNVIKYLPHYSQK